MYDYAYFMKSTSNACDMPEVGGTTILGERGQVVIPKTLREKLDLKKGDTFVIMRHGNKMIFIPSTELKEMIAQMTTAIESIPTSV